MVKGIRTRTFFEPRNLLKGDSLPVVEGMYRLPKKEAEKLLPQIPTHPISYKDAEPLLR